MPSVSTRSLTSTPYADILCYPQGSPQEARERISELEGLGVRELVFEGKTLLGRLPLLGKGCVSVVTKAVTDSGTCVVKIRRMDANRASMEREAQLLGLANSVGVGPRLHSFSANFMLMDLAEGVPFNEWVRSLRGRGRARRLRNAARELLDQCFKLDQIRLDHGELSNLAKHVFVGDRVTIIDFESASTSRRPANVTSVAQYVFIGSPAARRIRRMIWVPPQHELLPPLRQYKKTSSRDSYEHLVRLLRLPTNA